MPREGELVLLAKARTGDEDAFGVLIAPYTRELHVHCYRMLGSVHVQFTRVRGDEDAECFLIAHPGPGQQRLLAFVQRAAPHAPAAIAARSSCAS